jgi:FixJ family two-component response regulator
VSDPSFQIYLIDDDPQVLKALSRVLSLEGYGIRTFIDAETFLEQHDPELPGCAIVDLSLPGKDGFEIQQALESCGRAVIFLTGHGDVPASVKAMKGGALDFLIKPVTSETLLAAVEQAMHVDVARRQSLLERKDFEARIGRLTPRERQVLDHVVAGRLNKQIAGDLGVVEKTIKVHRARMMEKMGVRTVADLVRLVQRFAF